MIIGTYVKSKIPEHIPLLEISHAADTLILFADGYYESCNKCFGNDGKGVYEISNEPFNTTIHINYYEKYTPDGKVGLVGFSTYFTRWWFSRIRIILNSDLGIYYEKID
jgi:hypothetical protein